MRPLKIYILGNGQAFLKALFAIGRREKERGRKRENRFLGNKFGKFDPLCFSRKCQVHVKRGAIQTAWNCFHDAMPRSESTLEIGTRLRAHVYLVSVHFSIRFFSRERSSIYRNEQLSRISNFVTLDPVRGQERPPRNRYAIIPFLCRVSSFFPLSLLSFLFLAKRSSR